MLAPLIIDPLIASLLLLLAGWISDMVGQRLRHAPEPRICQISLHESTVLDFGTSGKVHGPDRAFQSVARSRLHDFLATGLSHVVHARAFSPDGVGQSAKVRDR